MLVKSPNSGEQRPSRSESEDSPPVGCMRGGVECGRIRASTGSVGTEVEVVGRYMSGAGTIGRDDEGAADVLPASGRSELSQ